jgi:heat shock protein HslJ
MEVIVSTSERPATDVHPAPGRELLGRTFVSSAVTDHGLPKPLVAGTQIRLTFTAETLGAEAGCNTLSFLLRIKADRLITGEGASTLIGCTPDRELQDQWLAGFLGADPTWAASSDGLLTLTNGETTIVLNELGVEAGSKPTALWGLRFESVLVSETGIVPAPVVEGTTIVLTFTAPDRLTAHAGCNTLNFQVQVTPSQLIVDDNVASTRMACSHALQAQDEWLTTFLTDDPHYTFTGGSLTLTRGSTEITLVSMPEMTS